MTPLVSFCWMGAGVISLTLAFVQLCCFLCSAFAISVSSVNSVQALNPQHLLVSQRLLCRAVQKVRCRFECAIFAHQLNSEAIVCVWGLPWHMAQPKASPGHSAFASPGAAHLEAQRGAVAGSAGPSAAELHGAGWAALGGTGADVVLH